MSFDFLKNGAGFWKRSEIDSSKKMSHFMQQFISVADQSNIGLAQSASQISLLVKNLDQVLVGVEDITEAIAEINNSANQVRGLTHVARENSVKIQNESQMNQKELSEFTASMHENGRTLDQAKTSFSNLIEQSQKVAGAMVLIKEIADQTKILSFNASVEASRAGEAGKSFSVVASEIKKLADRSMESVAEISLAVQNMNREMKLTTEKINQVQNEMSNSLKRVDQVNTRNQNSILQLLSMAENINKMDESASQNNSFVQKVSSKMNELRQNFGKAKQTMGEVADQAIHITELSERVYSSLIDFELDSHHFKIWKLAAQASTDVSSLFEKAINSQQISESELFSLEYTQIPRTNPQKFSTPYDRFTDQNLPAIQEPLLQDKIVYAFALCRDGYCPTHNKAFCTPLTGKYEIDLAKNRTKRIFSDRVGLRCGQNKNRALLQTYTRDTGEIMHDLSVPIFVRNRHWGAFRVGYRAQN